MYRITVFCGSASGNSPAFNSAAREFGTLLAESGHGLVYGGASIGLMGAVADACIENNGHVIGVIPQALMKNEIAHQKIQELRVVGSMHERKALMANLCHGFVALPGGFGTLDELCEIVTWAQLKIHVKPIGLLNTDGFYDDFLSFVDKTIQAGFIRKEQRSLLIVESSPVKLMRAMEQKFPPLP